jgi:MerR family mercuric resistance operon transcriptional regulator
MNKPLTIGKLADAVGVKVSTLRYYEREALLKPAGRSSHGYRHYDQFSLERLRFIRAAQAAGFSLDDINTLLRLRDRDTPPCETVRDLIDTRLEQVERQLADLNHVQDVLRDAHERCEAGEHRRTCTVLNQLDAASAEGQRPRILKKTREKQRNPLNPAPACRL